MKLRVASPAASQTTLFGSIILVLAVRLIIGNEKGFVILSVVLLAAFMVRGARFRFPSIPGFGLFCLSVTVSSCAGLYIHDTRDVLRDAFYILPSLLWVIIGYLLATNKGLWTGKSMLRTLYLYGALVTLSSYARFILVGDSSFNGIRQVFVSYVYDIGLLIPVVAYFLIVERQYQFSKRIDAMILILMLSQIVFSLGRISVATPMLGLLVLFLLLLVDEGLGTRSSRIFLVLATVLALSLVALFLMPQDAVLVLVNKLGRSLNEVNTMTDIRSVESAMNNWRAYEIQMALQQWRESSLFVQLFGSFLGTGVAIEFVPYNWSAMVEGGQIPILHNGFMTLLPKVGLLGLVAFTTIFIGTTFKGIKLIRTGGRYRSIGYVLVPLMVTSAVVTYVVRGPISETVFFVWGVLLGWTIGCADDQTLTPTDSRPTASRSMPSGRIHRGER